MIQLLTPKVGVFPKQIMAAPSPNAASAKVLDALHNDNLRSRFISGITRCMSGSGEHLKDEVFICSRNSKTRMVVNLFLGHEIPGRCRRSNCWAHSKVGTFPPPQIGIVD